MKQWQVMVGIAKTETGTIGMIRLNRKSSDFGWIMGNSLAWWSASEPVSGIFAVIDDIIGKKRRDQQNERAGQDRDKNESRTG